MFKKICILGGGLLGTSIALKCRVLWHEKMIIRLWVRRETSLHEAKQIGLENEATLDLKSAVEDADLMILAVPVGCMADLLKQAIEAGLPKQAMVTDVGSVKRLPHMMLGVLAKSHGCVFIGSHPMAGSEKKGILAAQVNLLNGARCLLTNDDKADEINTSALNHFWEALGCKTHWLSAEEHDLLVARISHLPHLVAAAAARVCLKFPNQGAYGGGGLRDTTRVAAGDAAMWTEIMLENQDGMLAPLDEMIQNLKQARDMLMSYDQASLQQWLEEAKQLRDGLI